MNSISVPIDYKLGDHCNIARDIRHGAKISWSKGIEIIWSLFSYNCGIMLKSISKSFENNPHIFKCNMTFTKRDL